MLIQAALVHHLTRRLPSALRTVQAVQSETNSSVEVSRKDKSVTGDSVYWTWMLENESVVLVWAACLQPRDIQTNEATAS